MIYMEKDMWVHLKKLAEHRGSSMADLVRTIIALYLNNKRKAVL